MLRLHLAKGLSRQAVAAPRTYATLREIKTRLNSIKNIEKITNTMMVVASTRVNKAHRSMETVRKYGDAAKSVYDKSEAQAPEKPEKSLLVVMSSDKGLCGSIHSQLARTARAVLAKQPELDLVVIGDKSKTQLSRTNPDNIVLSFNGVGKEAPSFNEAALIANEIQKLPTKYDKISLLYNRYVSSVSFEPATLEVFSKAAIEDAPKFSSVYELEEDGITSNLSEFNLANFILWGLAEGHAAEISSRRNAMDNASKNASDMIGKYSILYNRTRQAVITNELVDIITGASSLE